MGSQKYGRHAIKQVLFQIYFMHEILPLAKAGIAAPTFGRDPTRPFDFRCAVNQDAVIL